MTGLDTNVLVRYIMQDDPAQSPCATALIEALTDDEPGFISLVSVVELYWVLCSCYDLSKAQACQAIETMVRTRQLRIEQAEVVIQGLRRMAGSGHAADLPDCFIACADEQAGCEHTFTFDAGACKHAGMSLLPAATGL